MCELCVARWRRWHSAVLAGAVLIAPIQFALLACSGGGPAAQAKDAPIRVEASQFSVTIENRSGLPLQEIDVTILPIGGTPFTHFLGRLDDGERRESAVDEFRDRDGMRLSLRMVRPKTVRVSAKDVNGKAYNVEVPWS
jgi:hypothetical protein